MKRRIFLPAVLVVTVTLILLPVALMLLWSVTGRWPWPMLLPESWTLRTLQELLFGPAELPKLLMSSVFLAMGTAALSTVIALLAARATEIYRVPGRDLIHGAALLPMMIPGTVFAIGIQQVLLRVGLNDTVAGVLIAHLAAALPYSVSILVDVTAAQGDRLEQQAAVLGASPLRAFFTVTLPALMPGILSSVSMAFILSYSQYFTTLIVGGGRVKTLSLVLVPYIQSGDRALASIYAIAFVVSALLVFFLLEWQISHLQKRGEKS